MYTVGMNENAVGDFILKNSSKVLLVVVLIALIFGSVGTVRAGERGVKTRFGAIQGVLSEGLYFKLPLIESVTKIDIKTRTINYDKNGNEGDSIDTSQLLGSSRDLQDVHMGVVVNYHIDPVHAGDIFAQYSSTENYEYNVIEPIVREAVKTQSALYTAEELVTKRQEFSDHVSTILDERLAMKNAILERFSVTNFEFSPAFSQAIEAKVTAVQNAEAARNKLEQVKFEAEQTIEAAKAVAEAQRIQSAALTSAGGKEYVQLKAIEKWDGRLPAQMVPGGTVPFVNLTK